MKAVITTQTQPLNLLLQIPIIRRPRFPIPIAIIHRLPLIRIITAHSILLHIRVKRHLLLLLLVLHLPLIAPLHAHAVPHLLVGIELLLLLLVEGHVEAHSLLREAHLRIKSHLHGHLHTHWYAHHGHHRRLAVLEGLHLLDEGLFEVGRGIGLDTGFLFFCLAHGFWRRRGHDLRGRVFALLRGGGALGVRTTACGGNWRSGLVRQSGNRSG
jgi:hypothetical protein